MDYLREYAEEYGLEKIINSVADRPNVQGAILTLDEWWMAAWRQEEGGRGQDWDWWHWDWRHWGPMPYWAVTSGIGVAAPWIPLRRLDLSWKPPHWDALCHMRGLDREVPPVRLIICLRPAASAANVEIPELPATPILVSFEARPAARLSTNHRSKVRPVVGGVSLGSGTHTYGTLGGIVKDTSGVRYGMSCAHIFGSGTSVEQPALRDDPHASAVGGGLASIAPQPCGAQGPCNPYTGSPHIAAVDTALVEFRDGIAADLEILTIGPLAGLVAKNSMTPGQEVTFVGRTSGNRIAEVGGLALFYRLQMNGQAYCFRDLFEIRWRSTMRALLGPVVQAGDSGSWVSAETDVGPGWCGQIIGEDRHVGYATFAENTQAAWSTKGRDLSVV